MNWKPGRNQMNRRRQHRKYSFGSICFQPDPKHAQNTWINRDEIIDDELLDEYRRLNDENSSIGRVKLLDDKSLLDIEEV